MNLFQDMCENSPFIRSNPCNGSNLISCSMSRAMKTRDWDEQADRHLAERGRSARTGAFGEEVAGLARPRAC